MVSVALGTVIILSAHHSFDSWDEQIHYNIAYTDSWVWNYMEYSDAVMSNVEMRRTNRGHVRGRTMDRRMA